VREQAAGIDCEISLSAARAPDAKKSAEMARGPPPRVLCILCVCWVGASATEIALDSQWQDEVRKVCLDIAIWRRRQTSIGGCHRNFTDGLNLHVFTGRHSFYMDFLHAVLAGHF
jgi:hypothetical protein